MWDGLFTQFLLNHYLDVKNQLEKYVINYVILPIFFFHFYTKRCHHKFDDIFDQLFHLSFLFCKHLSVYLFKY